MAVVMAVAEHPKRVALAWNDVEDRASRGSVGYCSRAAEGLALWVTVFV